MRMWCKTFTAYGINGTCVLSSLKMKYWQFGKSETFADCTRLKIAPNKAMNTIIHLQSLNKTESVFITNTETTLELGDFKKEQKKTNTHSIVF